MAAKYTHLVKRNGTIAGWFTSQAAAAAFAARIAAPAVAEVSEIPSLARLVDARNS